MIGNRQAVVLGANVSATLIVQVPSFDVAQVAAVPVLLGVLIFRRASAGPRDFGRRYRLAVISNIDDDLFAASAQHLGLRSTRSSPPSRPGATSRIGVACGPTRLPEDLARRGALKVKLDAACECLAAEARADAADARPN